MDMCSHHLATIGIHLQWKLRLLQWVLTLVLTTLDGRPYAQEVDKQNQYNDIFVECLSDIALFEHFVLLDFLMYICFQILSSFEFV